MSIAVLIPAYRPGAELLRLVSDLIASTIVVVDDGSGEEFREVFDSIAGRATVLRHTENLGKGAALKTGLRWLLLNNPDWTGVVTADADGQHHPNDIARVAGILAANPAALVLGCRRFDKEAPWLSRIGNLVTCRVVRLVIGQKLADTQTGLRGIPRALAARLVEIVSNAYEFELDMLIAARHHSMPVVELPIRTVYFAGNRGSHFNPLLDSMRIYFVVLRFTSVSLATAAIDNLLFLSALSTGAAVELAQLSGRAVAGCFNYWAARRAVFLTREPHRATLPRYVATVLASGILSYSLLKALTPTAGLVPAKLAVEGLLFPLSFFLLRDFVFRTRKSAKATDWTSYYAHTPWTAKLTRRHTARTLLGLLRHCGEVQSIVELGGANSCFLDSVRAALRPRMYHVIDTNAYGLELLRARIPGDASVVLHEGDASQPFERALAEVAFSVGLIEHFDPTRTRRTIHSHFDLVPPGGFVILSFPTPTWLYRAARGIAIWAGVWGFPDERPLEREEVARAVAERGEILAERTLWPLVFTQHMMLARRSVASKSISA